MGDGETVHTVTQQTTYSVRLWDRGAGDFAYDWVASNGDESDELFDSLADAVYDIKGRH